MGLIEAIALVMMGLIEAIAFGEGVNVGDRSCLFTNAVSTQCHIHKNGEWRCAKDNYRADEIKIGNRRNEKVSFKIGKWNSTCGQSGSNYSNESYSLESGNSASINFENAIANECKELFVYDCFPDWCTNILTVNPS